MFQIVREGFERNLQYSTFDASEVCAALGAALGPDYGPIDPEMVQIVAAWPSLDESVQADIVAAVQKALGDAVAP